MRIIRNDKLQTSGAGLCGIDFTTTMLNVKRLNNAAAVQKNRENVYFMYIYINIYMYIFSKSLNVDMHM